MTRLERLWDDLPTPPPPTDAILREARRATRVRRRATWLRPTLAAGTVAAVGAAFAAGLAVSRSGDGTSPAPQAAPGATDGLAGAAGDASPVAFVAPLQKPASCQALLASYVDRGLAAVTAYGWQSPVAVGSAALDLQTGKGLDNAPAGPALPAAPEKTAMGTAADDSALNGLSTTRSTAGGTGTNVQEAGVDEPDTVKTDGHLLVEVQDDTLRSWDLTGAKPRSLATYPLTGFQDPQLLLSGSTVVVLGTDATSPKDPRTGAPRGGRVETISLADPAAPKRLQEVTYSAGIAAARQQGSTVRLVLSSGLPDLGFTTPGHGVTGKQAQADNRAAVQHSTLADWLPSYAVVGTGAATAAADQGSASRQLLDCGNVAVPPDKVGLGTTSVVGFDVAEPGTVTALGVAGDTGISYESTDQLYLAASPAPMDCWECGLKTPVDTSTGGGTTYLFQFDLDGTTATDVASGQVPGTLADRWSMDAADGTLRLALGRSSQTGDFNTVVTLRRHGTSLVPAGTLDHLGGGEQIKSVRWFDDLAIVTTFRQRDPLYVVDLRRPDRPALLGELSVPGYSDYLHPLGSKRLIGVGSGPDPDARGRWSAQLGLFDVHDLAHVRQLSVWHYAGGRPVAAQDPRAFTWLPGHRTVLTVIQKGSTGWLSVQRLQDGQLHNRMVQVAYGDDVASVRTIGLADGKVVLVTADGVSFLPV
jgi:hypothetical protein